MIFSLPFPGEVLLACILFVLWLLSVAIKNSSIIDLFWGAAFSVLFWPAALTHELTDRSILVGIIVSTWGLRLGLYLARRNLGHGEDKRYVAMRSRNDPGWWWKSLFIVFALQGVLAWCVSWPIRAVAAADFTGWGVLDVPAAVLSIAGVAFEALGDFQLSRFKADPANKGRIMDLGLWRYTRHPNYFGNALLWAGLGLFGLSVGAWWSLLGPAVMTFLLVKVSGKELLEKDMNQRPGYADYVKRTSGFIPRPPR